MVDTQVREKPVLFSGEMVKAILEGRKTQTRRVVKPRPPPESYWAGGLFVGRGTSLGVIRRCPFGVPGDRLWVRETWACPSADMSCVPHGRKPQEGDRIAYRANLADEWQWGQQPRGRSIWRPSIHMPRWACRLTLRVTDVRVERVQEISEEDARAESCEGDFGICSGPLAPVEYDGTPPEGEFAALWDSLNAKRGYGWDTNCFVWVVSFEREPGEGEP